MGRRKNAAVKKAEATIAAPQALAIVYRSSDDGVTWEPVKPDKVPEWCKHPKVMGRLLEGDMVQEKSNIIIHDGIKDWYRAERFSPREGETAQ